ncbi:MAG: hypothetical protein U0905_06070 [Pirellulales bacterium]
MATENNSKTFNHVERRTAMASIGMLLCSMLSSSVFAQDAGGMEYPMSVVANKQGVLFVADRNLPGIWKWESGKLTRWVSGQKQFRTPLNAIRCLAIDQQGNVLAGDSATREIYRIDAQGSMKALTGGKIGIPVAMGVDSSGVIYVADLERQCIFQLPSDGSAPVEWVKVQAARGLYVDGEDRVWVLSHSSQPLVRYTKEKKSDVILDRGMFEFSHHLVVDSQGVAFLCDGYGKSIWKIDASGKPSKHFEGEPLKNPVGIALMGNDLIIADPHQRSVFRLPTEGDIQIRKVIP